MPDSLQTYDLVEATFRPQRRDNLQNGATDYIGWHGQWMVLWKIDEGPYAGQWALEPYRYGADHAPWFGWVPESDLLFDSPVEQSEENRRSPQPETQT